MNPGALVRDEVKKTSVHIDTYRLGPDGGLSDSHYHRNLWAFIRYSTREELISLKGDVWMAHNLKTKRPGEGNHGC